MPKSPNLIGKIFARLTVVEKIGLMPSKKAKVIYWKCACVCGKYANVPTSSLINGNTKSCGCLSKENSAFIATTKIKNRAAPNDLSGMRFGLLTVIKMGARKKNKNYWICKCDCGKEKEIVSGSLTSNLTKSCGCIRKPNITIIHGAAKGRKSTTEYTIWGSMLQRCKNPKCAGWINYGGRGITVCDRWESFVNFYNDMGPRPSGMSIDRIDNDGPYSPENCKWSSLKEQSRNKRSNRIIEWNGKSQALAAWAEEIGMRGSMLLSRLTMGWSIEDALFTPKSEPRRSSKQALG